MKRVLALQLRRLLSKLNGNHNSNKNFILAVNRDQLKHGRWSWVEKTGPA